MKEGDRIGRYELGERVGRGGMGEVFRAQDTELGRPVALKRLLGSDRDGLVREARAAAQLQHPNVVAVHEIIDTEGGALLAMEWIDGVTLRAWLKQGPRTWREIVTLLVDAGRGLAAAHASGILHRDFKPENVLVDRAGRPRVADFGLARPIEAPEVVAQGSVRDEKPAFITAPEGLTPTQVALGSVAGSLAGTPAYLAPEMLSGRADARSDQYAFAVTLFESLHGLHPFGGNSPEMMWLEMAEGRVRRGTRWVPARIEKAIARGLAKDPADRWPDLATFLTELQRGLRRGRKRWILAAGALGAVAVGSLWLVRGSAPECGLALVDDVWSADAKATLTQSFTAAAPSHGATTATTAAALLDHWSDAWKLARKTACSAESERRTAQANCLDRQLAGVRAQLSVWEKPTSSVVDRAINALGQLPSPSDCTAAAPAPGKGPIVDITSTIEALQRAGKLAEAQEQVPALLALAVTEPNASTRSMAFHTVANVEHDAHEREKAREHAGLAARAAREARDDHRLVEALILNAHALVDDHRYAEAIGMCDAVEALLPDAIAPRVQTVRARALSLSDRHPEALAAYERALAAFEKQAELQASKRMELAEAIGAYGTALARAGKKTEGLAALRRCLVVEEGTLGPHHPEAGRTLHDIARFERELGQLDDAVKHALRSREIFAAAHGPRSFEVAALDALLSEVAVDRGDSAEAERLARSALAMLADLRIDEPQLLGTLETKVGAVLQERDDCKNAIPFYERALAYSLRAREAPAQQAISYVNLGGCLIDVGRPRDARPYIEKAIAAWKGTEIPERAIASALMVDIEYADGNHAAALTLAKETLASIETQEGDFFAMLRGHLNDQLAAWAKKKR